MREIYSSVRIRRSIKSDMAVVFSHWSSCIRNKVAYVWHVVKRSMRGFLILETIWRIIRMSHLPRIYS